MESSIPEELLNCIKGDYRGFDARLRELPYAWQDDKVLIAGKFFYLPFRDGEPTLNEFVEYIYHLI